MPLDRAIKVFLDAAAANGRPPISQLPVAEGRAGYDTYMSLAGTGPEMASVEDRELDGVPVRIYRPHGVAATGAPVLVWIHGGGWMIGSIDTDDCRVRTMAEKAGVVAISVAYRLAPEHPFPAAFDDCFAVVSAVAAKADELGVDAARLAVGGDSAGGNLSAAVALWARDRGGPQIAFQLLIYPATDGPDVGYPSRNENANGYFLTKDAMEYFWASYVSENDRAASRSDVRTMPMAAASLAGLPPAYVLTAEFDPLRDEGAAYAARLAADGVPTTYTNYDGCIHGFFGMQALFPVAGAAMDEAKAVLRAALSGAPPPVADRGSHGGVASSEARRNSAATNRAAPNNGARA